VISGHRLAPRRPLVCLVTDRVRLLGTPVLDEAGMASIAALAGEAARAGVALIQVREPDLPARQLSDLVRACCDAVAGTDARVLVNDRLDVALAAGAHGVHLRSASFPASEVRRLAPPAFVVGRSVHDAAEARAVAAGGDLDYLIAGTVFPTPSKPGARLLGLDGLRAVVEAAGVPVLAIGGIASGDRAAAVAGTGAAGVAAIGLFAGAADFQGWRDRLAEVFRRFDTGAGASLD
jgi:thiamine-phosphate diphosphorylase